MSNGPDRFADDRGGDDTCIAIKTKRDAAKRVEVASYLQRREKFFSVRARGGTVAHD